MAQETEKTATSGAWKVHLSRCWFVLRSTPAEEQMSELEFCESLQCFEAVSSKLCVVIISHEVEPGQTTGISVVYSGAQCRNPKESTSCASCIARSN
ncbi:hypothetical protein AV530_015315 [Patagioenas fasciata monilis]|uniref:Uncharacterized protein n=1 Tax=Patagioenas fasciata monilis TaxID=372326 RepID=A0A1V4K1M9_PATFA|nr:hypothetical protein AV530_015315 [Patagioenas fasciata monilis]